MEYKRHRIDILQEKAIAGDSEAQYQLARCLYYGDLVERSRLLAHYWVFKALENGHPKAASLYDCITAPHYTGNERYTSFAQSYDLLWGNYGIWGSSQFHGKYDEYAENQGFYRTYLYLRIFFLFFPTLKAYRVFEYASQKYRVLATEKMYWREMIILPLISWSLFLLFLILIFVFQGKN